MLLIQLYHTMPLIQPVSAAIQEIKTFLGKFGNNTVVTHPTTTLEDLFVRIVRDNTTAGGTSVGSG